MKRFAIRTLAVLAVAVLAAGCVTTGTHEKALADLNAQRQQEFDDMQGKLTKERDEQSAARTACETGLQAANTKIGEQETTLASMGIKVDQLLGEKGKLAKEREKLTDEQKQLMAQVEELKRMRLAAEKRNAEYRSLLEKLRKMMDAGTLQVKVRNGRMVVQMSSDIVFPPASVTIKREARDALAELAQTLATFENRRFQVVGHSDSNPIRTERFPSNWELSNQRAIEVVKVLVENGVRPEMISAAGAAEFDPLVVNDTPENRTQNRRVEIVFEPKIDELPGFDEVLQGK